MDREREREKEGFGLPFLVCGQTALSYPALGAVLLSCASSPIKPADGVGASGISTASPKLNVSVGHNIT
jgi:hypothetical protein